MLFGNTITACEVVKVEKRFCPAVKKLCFQSQIKIYILSTFLFTPTFKLFGSS